MTLKWNDVITYCDNNKIEIKKIMSLVSNYVNKCGWRTKFLKFRFDLYAKKRIEQKKLGYSHIRGSKVDAVRSVVNSKEFQEEIKKIGRIFKQDHVFILNKLISDNRERVRYELKIAFKNNGSDEII